MDLDADQHERIQELFLAALEQPPGARTAFLDDACDDAELRHAVEDYLVADALEDAFLLDEPLVRLTPEEVDETSVEGRRVGPYRLIRLLGRGGMGAVYLAEREDVGRAVALKVVRGDLADPTARKRFLFERRVLGRLEHPNIARLYDAGVDEDGTPYFAMEHVDGVPLTTYCDRERLGLDARLRLFEEVGRTVQHAHQHFIVHRDLKPSNILVTPTGEIKLLDFGIAKALDEAEEALDIEKLTATGRRLLTPAYAAPEQVTGNIVTAATDVYSLGVVLFELLTGRRPDTAATYEPPRPSTAVTEADPTETGATEADTATVRQTTTDRLARHLRGDLDVICQKALQPEADRRYASAEAFVDDIKRHLAGLPVAARRDSAGYRLKKFVRRHRQGFWASVAGVVLLALVVGFYTVRLQAERDRAQQELAKSREVTGFMLGLFEAGNPNRAQGDSLTARDLLARGARQAGALHREPEVQVAMLEVIGEAYHSLAFYTEADSVFSRALATSRAAFGADHPAVARVLSDLALVRRSLERFDEADSLYREALAMQRRLKDTDPLDLAETLWRLGILERVGLRDVDSAEHHLEEALELRRAAHGDLHPDVAQSLYGLAVLKNTMTKPDEAEPLYRQALAIRRATLGEAHLDLAQSIDGLGIFLREKGDLAVADSLLTEGLVMKRRLLGDADPRIGESLIRISKLREYQGDASAAESLLTVAQSIYESTLGGDHLAVARTTSSRGTLRAKAGDFVAADSLLRHALTLYRNKLGDDHSYLASMYDNLGMLLRRKADYAEAEVFFRQALAIDQTLGDHQYIALDLVRLGLVRQDQDDALGAERYYLDALALQRDKLPAEHRDIAGTLLALGQLYNDEGRHAEADTLLRESVAIYQERFGEDDFETAWARTHLGIAATRLRRYEEAEQLLQSSYTQLLDAQGAEDRQRERVRTALADLYDAWDRPSDAARYRPE